jgi:hypothetical protein
MEFFSFVARCFWNSFIIASGLFSFIELSAAFVGALFLFLPKFRRTRPWTNRLMKTAFVLSIGTFVFSWLFYAPYLEYKRVNDELELSKNPTMWISDIRIPDTDDLAHKSPRILFKVENAGHFDGV